MKFSEGINDCKLKEIMSDNRNLVMHRIFSKCFNLRNKLQIVQMIFFLIRDHI